MKVHSLNNLLDRRKELRKKQTPQEEKLWWYLKDRRLLGFKFRRQPSIGGYILDFYCAEKRLVVEIDGEIHKFNRKRDSERDNYLLEKFNIKIIRFSNKEILNIKVTSNKLKEIFKERKQSLNV